MKVIVKLFSKETCQRIGKITHTKRVVFKRCGWVRKNLNSGDKDYDY